MQNPLVTRLISIVGAVITIVPYVFALNGSLHLPPLLLALLLFVSIGFLTWYAVSEFRNWQDTREIKAPTDQKFYDFMRTWIDRDGDVAVFVKDLSWTKDESVRSVLLRKAQERCLTVIMEASIPFSRELSRAGAQVYYYQAIGFAPRSRFTMIDRHTEQSRVAVGWELGSSGLAPMRVIKVYRSGQDPFSSAAKDLIEFLMKYAQKCDGVESV